MTFRHVAVLVSPGEYNSSSSSVGATTLGGFWSALRFRSTIFYLYTSLSSVSISSSLDPLLLGQAISVLVFLLVLISVVPIRLLFLTILVVSILITCAAHRNLCDSGEYNINPIFLCSLDGVIRILRQKFYSLGHIRSLFY
jgi:hypothetical protein